MSHIVLHKIIQHVYRFQKKALWILSWRQNDDCGQCQYCLDKPKFRGPGRKKQRCTKWKCLNMMVLPYSHNNRAFLMHECILQSLRLTTLTSLKPASFMHNPPLSNIIGSIETINNNGDKIRMFSNSNIECNADCSYIVRAHNGQYKS